MTTWIPSGTWLDAKLGLRTLVKHPGLTLAATVALAVGIPVAMAPMHLADAIDAPLPEDRDGRLRAVRYWNRETRRGEAATAYELARWRDELGAFRLLGAYRSGDYRLTFDGPGDALSGAPLEGAEVTASTFDLLGTPPLMGRTLDRADEGPGAADVVVLGYDAWRSRLAADRHAVGLTLRVGGIPRTVVGVMPPGFLFPARTQLWLPLRDEDVAEPGKGRPLSVFGRLEDGVDPERAGAEAAASGRRLAAEFPVRNARLQVQVVPFGVAASGLPRGGARNVPGFFPFRLLCLALLLVSCANVAMLVFARTTTRFRELAVRTALGAGRGRIVGQMFVESLALTVSGAAAGLVGYELALGRLLRTLAESEQLRPLPYWFDPTVSAHAVGWALVLAGVCAVAVGTLPALKATGRHVRRTLREAGTGGPGGRFGGGTGALIVADMAVAVTAIGFAVGLSDRVRDALDAGDQVGIPAGEYLAVEIALPQETAVTGAGAFDREAFASRLAVTQRKLVERLEAEPGVRGVGVASELPRMDHERVRIEVLEEGPREAPRAGPGYLEAWNRYAATVSVDPGYFDALDTPILGGRGFGPADLELDVPPVIVNTGFVERILGGRNPVGRRIRLVGSPDAENDSWHRIVGVVGPLGTSLALPEYDAGVYVPAAPGRIHPLRMAVHVPDDPAGFAPRVRRILGEVDPAATLGHAVPLQRVYPGEWYFFLGTTAAAGVLALILVATAASGLYAIMSFAVSERTREIGVRTALGATPGSIGLTVARRSLEQLALGAALGVPLSALSFGVTEAGSADAGSSVAVAAAVGVAVVAVVGLSACLSPTLRASRIHPREALREG